MVAAASCSSACPLGLPSTIRGDIYTVAGNGNPSYSGDGGPATSADFNSAGGRGRRRQGRPDHQRHPDNSRVPHGGRGLVHVRVPARPPRDHHR